MSAAPFDPTPMAWRALPAPPGARAVRVGLVVRDFNAPIPPVQDAAAATAATDAEALRSRLEAARTAGFAAGEAAATAHQAQSRETLEATTLAAMATALNQSTAAARSAAMEAAQGLATLLLAALASALPDASARLAADQAARLAATLGPLLTEGLAVKLNVAAGYGDAAAARIADPRVTVAEDPTLPPGDASAVWRGGGASLSLAARQAAVTDMLACFQLQES